MAHNDVARRTSALPARPVIPRAAARDGSAPRETVRPLTRDLPGRALLRPLPARRLSRDERDAA
ncbi:hypothetical protein [Kitasatospora phosalacinea]|uniref:hypothetical protein n=1 Tax=Kitasatospora phosalacinea TaxID=2065 RepID=UPI000523F8FA|nr:hypothetical protein [Kitasatospora phosalacinea]